MHISTSLLRVVFCLAFVQGAIGFTGSEIFAQSQESKPGRESATPPIAAATPVGTVAMTGLDNARWRSPARGIQVEWQPEIWTVDNELIDTAYEGLQLGSDASTVYIEAYEGFNGLAEECLKAAEQEITERPNSREVTRLSGRTLPEDAGASFSAQLFGVIAELPDGTIYRGVEYVACRSLEPGVAVLETTWQTATSSYNDELPHVRELFASLSIPETTGT